MSWRTLEVFCDDARYPAMTDAQLSECIATIRAFSQGHPVRLESESWFGNFRSLLPMYWKYKQDAEYWKSWQDPDKIKRLEAENADLLAIAQGQREEIKRLRKNHLFRMLQVVLYRYRAGLCKRGQTDKIDRFADRIRDALTA